MPENTKKRILAILSCQPGRTLAQLSELLGLSKNTVVRHLRALEERDKVAREPCCGRISDEDRWTAYS